jgi:hypothetical protein
VNQVFTRWVEEIIKTMEEPFSSTQLKKAVMDKYEGSPYIESTSSLGAYLTRKHIVVDRDSNRGFFLYRRKTT